MRSLVLALAAIFALSLAAPAPGLAQAAGGASPVPKAARGTAAKPKREPTAGQLAARERMRKCAVEWKEAKVAKTTGGLKWPQYWSKCNARLKGGGQA